MRRGMALLQRELFSRNRKFVDTLFMNVYAGDGGNGRASFTMLPRKRVVPADGGNGGSGGSVVLIACDKTHDLGRVPRTVRAANGGTGGKDLCTGKTAKDIEIFVPVGTRFTISPLQTYKSMTMDETAEETEKREEDESMSDNSDTETEDVDMDPEVDAGSEVGGTAISHTLTRAGERLCVARGGRGGLGNAAFGNSKNRSPRRKTRGTPGESFSLVLELMALADVGLVGLPNTGKTSFLCAVTRARRKIADYAFTTLTPFVGTVEFSDYSRMTIADIPGIVEGAHENKGLGHAFLRHIERCHVLAYVVSLGPIQKDFKPPAEALKSLRAELQEYAAVKCGMCDGVCVGERGLQEEDEATETPSCGFGSRCLLKRPAVVLATKSDLAIEVEGMMDELRRVAGVPVFEISTITDANIDETLIKLRELVMKSAASRA